MPRSSRYNKRLWADGALWLRWPIGGVLLLRLQFLAVHNKPPCLSSITKQMGFFKRETSCHSFAPGHWPGIGARASYDVWGASSRSWGLCSAETWRDASLISRQHNTCPSTPYPRAERVKERTPRRGKPEENLWLKIKNVYSGIPFASAFYVIYTK